MLDVLAVIGMVIFFSIWLIAGTFIGCMFAIGGAIKWLRDEGYISRHS